MDRRKIHQAGFKYGGWTAPYGDEVYGKVVQKELKPADYLLGRKTFEIWAGLLARTCRLLARYQ